MDNSSNSFISIIPSLINGIFCTYFINSDREVFSFGKNDYYKLGHEDVIIVKPTKIKTLQNIKVLSCGRNFTACVDFDGKIFTFGGNNKGQLGINESLSFYTSTPQKISNLPFIDYVSCGNNFCICLSSNGYLYSFGDNSMGQLGACSIKTHSNTPIELSSISNIIFIECGGNSVFSKDINDNIYSWGNNSTGQLAQSTLTTYSTPTKVNFNPFTNTNIINILTRETHSLFLTSDGEVYGCGDNNSGQLGTNRTSKTPSPILINDLPLIKRIGIGFCNSMCIDLEDNLWVFGLNHAGKLGLGNQLKVDKPVINPNVGKVIDISLGGNHTFVKTVDNKIYSFGLNNYNQLGFKYKRENETKPKRVFQYNTDIWATNLKSSRQKSARK